MTRQCCEKHGTVLIFYTDKNGNEETYCPECDIESSKAIRKKPADDRLALIEKAQDALGKQQADDFRNADDRMTALEARVAALEGRVTNLHEMDTRLAELEGQVSDTPQSSETVGVPSGTQTPAPQPPLCRHVGQDAGCYNCQGMDIECAAYAPKLAPQPVPPRMTPQEHIAKIDRLLKEGDAALAEFREGVARLNESLGINPAPQQPRSCPKCGSTNESIGIYKTTWKTGEMVPLVECTACGYRWLEQPRGGG